MKIIELDKFGLDPKFNPSHMHSPLLQEHINRAGGRTVENALMIKTPLLSQLERKTIMDCRRQGAFMYALGTSPHVMWALGTWYMIKPYLPIRMLDVKGILVESRSCVTTCCITCFSA